MAKRGTVRRAIDAVTGSKPGKARRASTKKSASTGAAPAVVVEASAAPAPVAAGEQIVRVGRTPGVIVGRGKRKRMPTKKSERKKAKKGIVAGIKRRLGFGKGKRKTTTGGKRRTKRGKNTSAGMVLYHAQEVSPGVYEAAPSSRRKRGRKSSGGMVVRSGGKGGPLAKPKGMEYLTLGVTAIGGAPLGYYLQGQAQVPIPFTSKTIGRGSLAALVSLLTTLFLRKRMPKVARHTAALTIGTAAGVLVQKRAANAEGSTTA